MKKLNFKKSMLVVSVLTFALGTNSAFAANQTQVNATPAAIENSLPSLSPISGAEGVFTTFASSSKTVKTDTKNTLTSNTWLGSVDSNGLADYQVSANYDATDHKYIETRWKATIGAVSTTTTASVSMNFPTGVNVTATTTSTVTQATTSEKYYQNTQSQQDSSYRSNVAIQGDWKYITMTNVASCWGGSIVKKASITSQATQNK
ncbi:hypothetical protein [Paenibacillus apis]|uniref:Uncharacterized protein n=1 Tax=Paenibacillus apis TaxID=1792174 RepID=A0A919XZM3_9BACL|nr:hypothetical protein [Paenibacillus apis]GIO42216.1 hypothetical protein J41TS4_19740 [Paenibacillus apis]